MIMDCMLKDIYFQIVRMEIDEGEVEIPELEGHCLVPNTEGLQQTLEPT